MKAKLPGNPRLPSVAVLFSGHRKSILPKIALAALPTCSSQRSIYASDYKFHRWSGIQCGPANRVLRSPHEPDAMGNFRHCLSHYWGVGFKKPSIGHFFELNLIMLLASIGCLG